jgi:hypothetical protein
MRCRACNEAMSDQEAARKYPEPERIKNPEDRYIGLCNPCLKGSDLVEMVPLEDSDYAEVEADDGQEVLE